MQSLMKYAMCARERWRHSRVLPRKATSMYTPRTESIVRIPCRANIEYSSSDARYTKYPINTALQTQPWRTYALPAQESGIVFFFSSFYFFFFCARDTDFHRWRGESSERNDRSAIIITIDSGAIYTRRPPTSPIKGSFYSRPSKNTSIFNRVTSTGRSSTARSLPRTPLARARAHIPRVIFYSFRNPASSSQI